MFVNNYQGKYSILNSNPFFEVSRKLNFFYILIIVLVGTSCSTDPVDKLVAEGEIVEKLGAEEAFSQSGYVTEVYYAGQKVPVRVHNGYYIYQGDILLPPALVTLESFEISIHGEIKTQSKSAGRTSHRWVDNIVYYEVADNLENKNRVYDAIKHWEAKTPLIFKERSWETDYIYFKRGLEGDGCTSFIGMIGGKQEIILDSNCSTGSTIHEIGHAIGLWHEQSRADRDDYITINYENIEEDKVHNFHTYEEAEMDGFEFTEALDFDSIMMYGPYSFSKNGLPTIVRKDGSTYSVQKYRLSEGDIEGVNEMYPSSGGAVYEEIYKDGNYYTVYGLLVYRMHGRWYFYSSVGWREVKLQQNSWSFA